LIYPTNHGRQDLALLLLLLARFFLITLFSEYCSVAMIACAKTRDIKISILYT